MKLCEMCSINMGQSPDSSSYNEEGNGMPFYQGNADFGEIHPVTRVWCTEPTKTAHPDDILMSVRAPIGALNIANEECCIGRGLAAITVDSKVCTRQYLWYALESKKEELISKGTGSTFKAICKNVLFETEIPFVPLDKQRKIERILDKITRLIADRKKQLSLFDELTASRFIELFGDPVKNDRQWNTISLGDACDGIGDGLHGTPEYSEHGNYPFINGNNLMNGIIEITPATKMVDESTYYKHFIDLSNNAILISINGTLGKLALYNGEQIMLGKSACYCNLKPEINRKFVYWVMKSDSFADFLESNSTKSTIKNVGLKAMRDYKLIIPPKELQELFVSLAEQTDKSKFYARLCIDLHQNERMRIIP